MNKLKPCRCARLKFPHRHDRHCDERAESDAIAHEQDRDYWREINQQMSSELAAERGRLIRSIA